MVNLVLIAADWWQFEIERSGAEMSGPNQNKQ